MKSQPYMHAKVTNFWEKVDCRKAAIIFITGLFVSSPVFAYVGPGLGLGIIGAILGTIVAIFLAIFGLLWYPIKSYMKKRKGNSDELAESVAPEENEK